MHKGLDGNKLVTYRCGTSRATFTWLGTALSIRYKNRTN